MQGLYCDSSLSVRLKRWESIPIQRLNCYIFYSIGRQIAHAEDLIRTFQRRHDPLLATDVQGYFGALKGPLHTITIKDKRNPFPAPVQDAAEQVKKRLHFVEHPSDGEGIVSKIDLEALAESVQQLQTVFQFEAPRFPIFVAARRGMYNSNDLIDHAEEHLTDETMAATPEQCRIDIRAAGRCLAFDMETASAFHMLRAIESMIKAYYHRLTGKTFPEAKIPRNWGKYIDALRDEGALDSILAQLEIIKTVQRNPILHPEENVGRDDGLRLFECGIVLIDRIVYGMQAAPPPALE